MVKDKVEFGAKQTTLNLITQVISFVVNMLIGFFLTPFIVNNIQVGYGFISLSSNFISYATLITTAINSMAGRFIAISYFKKEEENVLKYYSSVFFANVFLCLCFSVPVILLIVFLPNIIDIPTGLESDVRALFLLVFSHFFVDLIFSTFANSGYVLNRLDLVAMRKTEATVLKGILTFAIFSIFIPKLWYVGFVQLLCCFYNGFRNYSIHKKLMPNLKISKKYFDIHKVAELVSSGIWNTISSAGSVLMNNLDVLIVNLAIDATAMDMVSIAKYVPIYIQSLVVTLATVFSPKQTKLFADGNLEGMKKTLVSSSRFTAVLTCLPVVFMVVYGEQFFTLWVPTKDAEVLWILAVVAVSMYPVQLVASTFSAVISSANKVKLNSLVTIGVSAISLLTIFILLNVIDNELIKMCVTIGCSMLFSTLQVVFFTVPYCARIIKCKPFGLYVVFIQSVICVVVSCGLCLLVSKVFMANNWIKLILSGIIVCIIGVLVGLFVVLGNKERKDVFLKIKSIFTREKESK